MAVALGWGAVAASSLILGALLGIVRTWPDRAVGAILAFGAGALISAVSFDLAEEGVRLGGADSVAIGLAVGAVSYFVADRFVDRLSQPQTGTSGGWRRGNVGTPLALGAFLDGIPEQMVLGIALATGGGISVGPLAAIFVSNLLEAAGSATEMRAAGRTPSFVMRLWVLVAVICTLATVAGYGIADSASGDVQAARGDELRGWRAAGHADRLDDS